MKNRNVGYLIVGIAAVIGIIVFLFNRALTNIVSETCSHGPACTMYTTINSQTWLSLAIAGVILVIGLFFIFTKESEKLVVRTIKEKRKKLDLSSLDNEERKVVDLLLNEHGAMFQSTLMEKMEIGKVKTTRLLDKLEAKQLIERKRRGMNNIVVIKYDQGEA
jgi:beta-lactamase regulating signal transducer with metallopeptidase domain